MPSADELDKTTNDVVAPWWNVPYEEQTSRKEREMRQVLKRCNRRISRKDSDKEKKKVNRAGSVKQPCRDFMSKGSCIAAKKRLGAALRMARAEQLRYFGRKAIRL